MALIAFCARGAAARIAGYTRSFAAARGKRDLRHSNCIAVPREGHLSKKD